MFATAPPVDAPRSDAKDEDEALGLSLFGSVVGLTVAIGVGAGQPKDNYSNNPSEIAMTAAGLSALVAMPSLGHWYAGDADIVPLLVRSLGAATLIYGLTGPNFDCGNDTSFCFNLPSDRQFNGVMIGGALLVAGTIYDLATSHRAARKYNHEHHLDVQIAPMVSRTMSGNTTGLAIGGSF